MRFDGATGQETWRYSSTGLLDYDWAVRSDGTILVVENSNSTGESALVGIDGATGLARWRVPIPHSTWEYFDSACSLQIQQDSHGSAGPPMVAPDGTVYMEVSVSTRLDDSPNCLGDGVPTKLEGNVLLLQATPEGSPIWSAPISTGGSIPDYFNYTVGEVIPDGQGGLLASWVGILPFYNGYYNYPIPYLTHVTASGNVQYQFPQNLGTYGVQNMVLGENGTAFAALSTAGNKEFASFNIATGAVNWTWIGISGSDELMAATDDSGIAVRSPGPDPNTPGILFQVDDSGNAISQPGSGADLSWSTLWYAASAEGVYSPALPLVPLASSEWVLPKGNPSADGASVPALTWIDGRSFWSRLFRGPSCKLGADRVLLSGTALQKYNDLKQALLTGGYLTCPSCASFFNQNPTRAPFFGQLTAAVTRQVPFDGKLTNISMYDAGIWTAREAALPPRVFNTLKVTPVCSMSQEANGLVTVAQSQIQPPATDVYINPGALKRLTQSTIIHEALHNLTGLEDIVEAKRGQQQPLDLKTFLGIPSTPGPTDDINKQLEQQGCAIVP